MSLREQLENKNCFKIFKIAEWNTGDAEYSLRSLTSDEMAKLAIIADSSEDQLSKGARMFSVLFGNSVGNRAYDDSDADLALIRKNIPLLVIGRVVVAGMEFNADSIKKN